MTALSKTTVCPCLRDQFHFFFSHKNQGAPFPPSPPITLFFCLQKLGRGSLVILNQVLTLTTVPLLSLKCSYNNSVNVTYYYNPNLFDSVEKHGHTIYLKYIFSFLHREVKMIILYKCRVLTVDILCKLYLLTMTESQKKKKRNFIQWLVNSGCHLHH